MSAVWICDQCRFSRTGRRYRKCEEKNFDGTTTPSLELCCKPCWDAFLAVDPSWDYTAEGWSEVARD